ncbi:MAG: hypothetical protein P4M11_14645 [Candidatus Pacebacteria bacterium]|nr:hypothetical protein [Candidatus Paceibacterota bacterium]
MASIVVLAGSIMLGLSFSIVGEEYLPFLTPVSEYGLRFDMATNQFFDEVDGMGRHFVGTFYV